VQKKLAIVFVFIFCFVGISPAHAVSFTLEGGLYNSPPEPRLRNPIYDAVILNSTQPLEFSWWNDVTGTRGMIFKIYKGYNMYEDNLIHKEDLPDSLSSVKIDSALFEDGEIYTWSLVRVGFSGKKSDKSFNSFKIIKNKNESKE
jgi:hypothetical protein